MKKISWVTFAVICISSLTGCWDRVEVKDLAIVLASGIDRTQEGELHETLQITVPSELRGGGGGNLSSGGSGKNFVLATAIGQNLKSLDHKLQGEVPRRLYFTHRAVVIIGEDQAKTGIRDILDYYARDPMNRLRTMIVVVKGATAEEILKTPTVLEKVPGQEIKHIVEQEHSGVISMLDFLKTASSEGIIPTVPAIQRVESTDGHTTHQKLVIAGTAVFKDFKLAGYLPNRETRGFLCLTGKIHHAEITAYIPQGHGTVTMTLLNTGHQIQPIMKGNRIVFNVKLEGKGSIDENTTNLNLGDVKNFELAKQALNEKVKTEAQQSFVTAQEYGSDVFGFGQEIARSDPGKWEKIKDNWNETFKAAKLDLTVDIQPTGIGSVVPPLHLKEDEVKQTS